MSEQGGISLIKAPCSHLALQESIQGCFLLHLPSLFVPYLCLWLCLSTQILQTDVEISLVLDSGFPQCCLQTSLVFLILQMRKQKYKEIKSLAQSHTNNDWHRDLYSDLLTQPSALSNLPPSTKAPSNSHWTLPGHTSPGTASLILFWRVICLCPAENHRIGLISLWHNRSSNVWNSNPVPFESYS